MQVNPQAISWLFSTETFDVSLSLARLCQLVLHWLVNPTYLGLPVTDN